jgi:hypothetical protein
MIGTLLVNSHVEKLKQSWMSARDSQAQAMTKDKDHDTSRSTFITLQAVECQGLRFLCHVGRTDLP